MPCARSFRVAHDRTGNLPTMSSVAAAEALLCGLVSTVSEPEGLFEAGLALARRIAVNPAPTLRLTKKLGTAYAARQLELSAVFQALAHKTPQHDEAVAAFIEKRKPSFD
jgi:enoyl-CoA hydratase/carnithine racemase